MNAQEAVLAEIKGIFVSDLNAGVSHEVIKLTAVIASNEQDF